MLLVNKTSTITTVDSLKGIYSPLPITISNMNSVDLTNAVDFSKTTSSEVKETFLAYQTNSLITHIMLIFQDVVVGYIELLDPVDMNIVKEYQINILYSTSYLYAQTIIKINEEYANHSANVDFGTYLNGEIQHKDFFTRQDSNAVANKNTVIAQKNHLTNNRKGLKIITNNNYDFSFNENLQYFQTNIVSALEKKVDNGNVTFVNKNTFYKDLFFYYNLEEFLNDFVNIRGQVFIGDVNNYIDYTYLGYSAINGLIVYTVIPINIIDGYSRDTLLIYSGCNNTNTVYYNYIKGMSIQVSKLNDIQRPLFYFYDSAVYFYQNNKLQVSYDFKWTELPSITNNNRLIKKFLIDSNTVTHNLSGNNIFSEIGDLTGNGYNFNNNSLNFVNFNGEVQNYIEAMLNGLSFPDFIYNEKSNLTNITNNAIAEGLFALENYHFRNYQNIYLFDNFAVKKIINDENDNSKNFYNIYQLSSRNSNVQDLLSVNIDREPLLWTIINLPELTTISNMQFTINNDNMECITSEGTITYKKTNGDTFTKLYTTEEFTRPLSQQELDLLPSDENIYAYFIEDKIYFSKFYPIVSIYQPVAPVTGTLWFDTRNIIPILREFRDNSWEELNYSAYAGTAIKTDNTIVVSPVINHEFFTTYYINSDNPNYGIFNKRVITNVSSIQSSNDGCVVCIDNVYYIYYYDGSFNTLYIKNAFEKLLVYRGVYLKLDRNSISLDL